MKSKSILSIVLIFMLSIGMVGCKNKELSNNVRPSDVQKAALTMAYTKGNVGDTIKVTISCAVPTGAELSGVQFDLTFNKDVLSPVIYYEKDSEDKENSEDKEIDSTRYFTEQLAKFGINLVNMNDGSVRFMAADVSFANPIVNTSDIVVVEFKVLGELSDDSLNFENVEMTDMEANIIEFDLKKEVQ